MKKGKWLLWALSALLLAGCSLAQPEAEGRDQDRFAGFYVVRGTFAERGKLWSDSNPDLTEYGSDAVKIDRYGSFDFPRRVLMGVKEGENYRFPGLENGYSLYILQRTLENGNRVTEAVSNMAPSEEGMHITSTGEGEENIIAGTIYYGPPLGDEDWEPYQGDYEGDEYRDRDNWTVYRVYQTPEGVPYLDGGGNSYTGGGIGAYTETHTFSRQENGVTTTDSVKVTVKSEPVPRLERLTVTQFDEHNAVVRADDLALREELPEVTCEKETVWVLVEEVSRDGMVRTVYNVPQPGEDPVSHSVVLLDDDGLGQLVSLMIRPVP